MASSRSALALSLALLCGCTSEPMPRHEAVRIARQHVMAERPALDIGQKEPTVQFFQPSERANEDLAWVVGFAYPALRGPDGKNVGVRPYIGLAVYLNDRGEVVNTMTHSP